jgi:hypothetical protein
VSCAGCRLSSAANCGEAVPLAAQPVQGSPGQPNAGGGASPQPQCDLPPTGHDRRQQSLRLGRKVQVPASTALAGRTVAAFFRQRAGMPPDKLVEAIAAGGGCTCWGRRPPPVPWEACWVRWPDFRLPSDPADAAGDQANAYVRRHSAPRAVETPWQRRFVTRSTHGPALTSPRGRGTPGAPGSAPPSMTAAAVIDGAHRDLSAGRRPSAVLTGAGLAVRPG